MGGMNTASYIRFRRSGMFGPQPCRSAPAQGDNGLRRDLLRLGRPSAASAGLRSASVWPISHSAQQCGHPALIWTPSSDIAKGWDRRLCYFWLETWGAKSSNGSISLLNGYFVSVPCTIRSEAIVGMGK
jgi:hypothetical protein